MHFKSFVLTAASIGLFATAAVADVPVNFAYRDAKSNIHDFHFDGKAWQKLQLNNGGMTAAGGIQHLRWDYGGWKGSLAS